MYRRCTNPFREDEQSSPRSDPTGEADAAPHTAMSAALPSPPPPAEQPVAMAEEDLLFWRAVQVLHGAGTASAEPAPPPPLDDDVSPTTCKRAKYLSAKGNRCGTCPACLRQDCGSCLNCLDKPKFGGRGARKQACLMRLCSRPWLADAEPDAEPDADADADVDVDADADAEDNADDSGEISDTTSSDETFAAHSSPGLHPIELQTPVALPPYEMPTPKTQPLPLEEPLPPPKAAAPEEATRPAPPAAPSTMKAFRPHLNLSEPVMLPLIISTSFDSIAAGGQLYSPSPNKPTPTTVTDSPAALQLQTARKLREAIEDNLMQTCKTPMQQTPMLAAAAAPGGRNCSMMRDLCGLAPFELPGALCATPPGAGGAMPARSIMPTSAEQQLLLSEQKLMLARDAMLRENRMRVAASRRSASDRDGATA